MLPDTGTCILNLDLFTHAWSVCTSYKFTNTYLNWIWIYQLLSFGNSLCHWFYLMWYSIWHNMNFFFKIDKLIRKCTCYFVCVYVQSYYPRPKYCHIQSVLIFIEESSWFLIFDVFSDIFFIIQLRLLQIFE